MCPPILIPIGTALTAGAATGGAAAAVGASALMGVASAGLQIQGQRQMAKTQAKAQRNATIAEQQRHLQQMSAMRIQERQEKVAAAQRIQQATTKSREARATARVSAGEAGVAGLSVNALINDLTRQQAEYNFSVTQQLEMSDVNRQLSFQDAGMQSRMNLLSINKPIQQPNYLGAILDGAQTGLSAYSAMDTAGVGAPKATDPNIPIDTSFDFSYMTN